MLFLHKIINFINASYIASFVSQFILKFLLSYVNL